MSGGRAGFVVDLNRCTGCRACELACVIANRLPVDRAWREVSDYNESHLPGVESFHLSLACNHCAAAPCMEQCPARACHRDPGTGAVLIDEAKCIGCGYCAWVCPWDAPKLDENKGVMTKCTLCRERLGEGREPACVTGCPTAALGWEAAVGDGPPATVPGFAVADTGPAVRLLPLDERRRRPRVFEPPVPPVLPGAGPAVDRKITLAGEWPLALFTFLLALLAGLFTGSQFGGPAPDWRFFLAVGMAGLLLGASHLGRKVLAWRAGLQAGGSWLSREVVLYGVFLAAGAAVLAVVPESGFPGWVAAVSGLGAALSADMVYRVARFRGGGPLHSALVLPTALLVAAVWGGAVTAALVIATLKMALYVARKAVRHRRALNIRPPLSIARIALLAGGSAALTLVPGPGGLLPLVLITVSEAIDRGEYYDELELATPASLMRADLEEIRSGLSS